MWLLLVLASCVLASLTRPEQIRLAWTENANEISVRWTTYAPMAFSQVAYRPVECNGKDIETKWTYLDAEIERFKEGDEVYEIQFIHTAVIKYLVQFCDYEYTVGTSSYWSEPRRFQGLTPGSDVVEPVSFIILGDLGVGSNSSDVRAILTDFAKAEEFIGLLHLGDLGYDLDDDGGYRGDLFLNDIEPIASRAAYMTMPGNHEHYQNFTQYIRRFRMPQVAEAGKTSFFYSFVLGKAHFTVLNSEVYFYLDETSQDLQMEWLIQDLKKANDNRNEVPWLFAFAHKPMYCSVDYTLPLDNPHTNTNCYEQANIMKEHFEELFYKEKVDIYFSGHVHNYQRMTAIYQNLTVPSEFESPGLYVNPKAPIYILTGDAGSDHGHEPLSSTPQDWNVYGNEAYGFGQLTVFNETHIHWEQYDAEAGIVADSLWVVKTSS